MLIALIGAAVGFLGGLFGKGGSAVATPLLAAVGLPPLVALASPLPATVPGTLVAYRRYRHQGFGDRRVIGWSLAFGAPATVAGALLTRWIPGRDLVGITDLVVTVLGLRILASRHQPGPRPGSDAAPVALDLSTGQIGAVAVAVGLASGLLANAGGFLLVPLYLTVLHLPIKTALSSSLAVASVLALPGTVVHAALGHVDWSVTVVFGAASVPLSGVGARTALRLGSERLERVYGAGLTLIGASLGTLWLLGR